MAGIEELRSADVERIFEDWGRPAAFVEATRTYDPQSGRLEESTFVTEIMAIPGAREPKAVRGTAAGVRVGETWFLVRLADLPPGAALTSGRIEMGDVRHEIRGVRTASLPGVLVIDCASESGSAA